MALLGNSPKEREIRRIIGALTKAVCEQRIAPGTRLVEAQLVETFEANRNHVRAALQRLALKKIVTIESNRGASISSPSVEEAHDIFTARSVIERGVIELVCHHNSPQAVKKLRHHVQHELNTIARGVREDIITASGDFHLLLAQLSCNEVLKDLLNDLITRSSLIIALYQRGPALECGCDDHQELIAAIESGDVARAIECMKHHMDHIEASLNLGFWKNRKVDLKEALKI